MAYPDFTAGYQSEVYVAQYDWTEWMNQADMTAEQDVSKDGVFRRSGKIGVVGQADGGFELAGLWDYSRDNGVTAGPEDYFTGIFDGRTRLPVTVARSGGGLGDRAHCAEVSVVSYKVTTQNGDITKFSLSVPTRRYGIDGGVIAHARGAETTSTTSAAQDLGFVPTTARAYLHVIEASGTGPTLDITIEDSANGSSGWASAATFTQVTTESWQVLNIGVIKQHVRVKSVIAGTNPSFSYVIVVCPTGIYVAH